MRALQPTLRTTAPRRPAPPTATMTPSMPASPATAWSLTPRMCPHTLWLQYKVGKMFNQGVFLGKCSRYVTTLLCAKLSITCCALGRSFFLGQKVLPTRCEHATPNVLLPRTLHIALAFRVSECALGWRGDDQPNVLAAAGKFAVICNLLQ